MYRRLSAVMFPIMTLALIGAVVWGYQENQEKNSILIKAENQYQRAFHDLSFHMDNLHKELGNALVVSSSAEGFQRKSLVNVWRLTSEAQNEINQLPLTLLPFNKTEEFLANIANFSYQTSVRDLTAEPLTADEMKNLKSLYDRSADIYKELSNVQTKVLNKNLRWMDVEVALATEKKGLDNTIIDGFKTVDKRVNEYPEINWGPSVSSLYQKRSYKMLSGNFVKPEEIKERAAKFLNISPSRIEVTENGKGTEYSSYSATASLGNDNGAEIQMDFVKKGGGLIWYMNTRDVRDARIAPEEAVASAKRFLQQHHYPQMKEMSYEEYDDTASITYASVQNGIVVLPEKIVLKVALDNGDVIGLEAADYLYEQKNRTIEQPKLTKQEAQKSLNKDFKMMSSQLALIKNDTNKEVLCYLFDGRINGSQYRVYVNAKTGVDEKVEVLKSEH